MSHAVPARSRMTRASYSTQQIGIAWLETDWPEEHSNKTKTYFQRICLDIGYVSFDRGEIRVQSNSFLLLKEQYIVILRWLFPLFETTSFLTLQITWGYLIFDHLFVHELGFTYPLVLPASVVLFILFTTMVLAYREALLRAFIFEQSVVWWERVCFMTVSSHLSGASRSGVRITRDRWSAAAVLAVLDCLRSISHCIAEALLERQSRIYFQLASSSNITDQSWKPLLDLIALYLLQVVTSLLRSSLLSETVLQYLRLDRLYSSVAMMIIHARASGRTAFSSSCNLHCVSIHFKLILSIAYYIQL